MERESDRYSYIIWKRNRPVGKSRARYIVLDVIFPSPRTRWPSVERNGGMRRTNTVTPARAMRLPPSRESRGRCAFLIPRETRRRLRHEETPRALGKLGQRIYAKMERTPPFLGRRGEIYSLAREVSQRKHRIYDVN